MNTAVQEKQPDPQVLVADAPYSKRESMPVPAGAQPANLMQALAIAAADPRMELAKVQGLWAMHKDMMDRAASEAFNDAMARAQANIQPIVKNRRNDHTKSTYATLSAINDEVSPIYSAEGLAVSFDTYSPERDKDLPELEKGWVRVIAIVSHRGGHTRKYHLDGPLDDKGSGGTTNKTGIQAMGSTVSYLRRYLVCMIFNVSTADDNDGNGAGSGKKMEEGAVAGHLAKMDAAMNEADLMKFHGTAWNAAEELKDKDAQRVFMTKRDERRKVLKAPGR